MKEGKRDELRKEGEISAVTSPLKLASMMSY
jgi:hypothetical protein